MGHYRSDFVCDTCGEYGSPCKCSRDANEKHIKDKIQNTKCKDCKSLEVQTFTRYGRYDHNIETGIWCNRLKMELTDTKTPSFCPKKSPDWSTAKRNYYKLLYESGNICNLDNKIVQKYVKELESK